MFLHVWQQRPGRAAGKAIRTRSATIIVDGNLVKKIHQKEHLYRNERYWLERLEFSGVTTKIDAHSDQELSITMRYSGEPISPENAPDDWRRQLTHILECLQDAECHHGDLLPQNILVHEGRLTVIDFALASSCGNSALRENAHIFGYACTDPDWLSALRLPGRLRGALLRGLVHGGGAEGRKGNFGAIGDYRQDRPVAAPLSGLLQRPAIVAETVLPDAALKKVSKGGAGILCFDRLEQDATLRTAEAGVHIRNAYRQHRDIRSQMRVAGWPTRLSSFLRQSGRGKAQSSISLL